jgi:RNA polymerase sigma factor (sigma-70 family)
MARGPAMGEAAVGVLFRVGALGAMTDGQLLGRFLAHRDDPAGEAAFAALATRHGPMVLGACRAVLRDEHAAEDAFQATFLVLARRAGSLREAERLGPWLHRVARRVALRARSRSARQQARAAIRTDPGGVAAGPDDDAGRREARAAVHEEVDRLPEKYRAPVVLCHLEGLSYDEVAHRLRCPVGTVRSRLARARERLRWRLARRGLAPAVGVLGATTASDGAAPAALIAATARAATAFAAGRAAAGAVPAAVASLAEGALTSMAWIRGTKITAAALVLGLAAAAGAAAFQQAGGRPEGSRPPAAKKRGEAAAKKDEGRSLLTNGGVEEGRDAPTAWRRGAAVPGVQYLWDRKVAHGGRASLALKKTAARYFPIAQWSQEVPHSGRAIRLKVGAWVKADKVTKAILDAQFYDEAGEMTHQWAAYIGAKEPNDPPATHPWKWYEETVDVPAGTKRIAIAPQIYGPGTVWFDDLVASPADEAPAKAQQDEARGDADVADVPSRDRTAGGDPKKRYLLVGPTGGAAPPEGYRLLVVLPGGDGGADFNPFVRRIAKHALPPGYLVAQPVAFEWAPGQAERIVWPVEGDDLPGMKFSTEAFVAAVIADVRREHKVDPRSVFVLGWSSGGPPAYAASLRPDTGVTGSFVAMSVFDQGRYASLGPARGRAFYILHSPEDFIPLRAAESARDALHQQGAQVALATYEGGHGWHGDVFGQIRRGVRWLEAHRADSTGR